MATRDVFTDEELDQLRRFPDISREELIRYFTLTPADEAFVVARHGAANRLGAAVADRFGAVGPSHQQLGRQRIWVTWQSAQRTRRGVTVTVSAPTPRTVRVRPVPNGHSTPRHRWQGMSPASGISSARSGYRTTITAHV